MSSGDQMIPLHFEASRTLSILGATCLIDPDVAPGAAFGQTHMNGLRGVPPQAAYSCQAGYVMNRHRGYHEAMHAFIAFLYYWLPVPPGGDWRERLWKFLGYRNTFAQQLADANAQTTASGQWNLLPEERIAEAGASALDGFQLDGVPLPERVRSFLLDLMYEARPSLRPIIAPSPGPPPPVVPTAPTFSIEWLGPAANGNFDVGRSGNPVSLIVDHWVGRGDFDQAVAHFKTPGTIVSAQYIVGTDGRIGQIVSDDDTAFHAGNYPTNQRSIGIEHEARPDLLPSDALYNASAWLHAQLAAKYGLTLEVGVTVRPHRDFFNTACPGTLDLDEIVKRAEEDMFTEADRQMLARVKDILEAREPMVWAARQQRFLDVERGTAYDPNKPTIDQRIKQP